VQWMERNAAESLHMRQIDPSVFRMVNTLKQRLGAHAD
jgi:hypothetical protein